jgi:hypothetical protein
MIRFALVTLLLLAVLATPSYADPSHSRGFVKLSDAEKSWYYIGAFSTLGMQIAQTNKAKADCIWGWYFDDQSKAKKELENVMRQYPDRSPSTAIMAVLYRDCGKF